MVKKVCASGCEITFDSAGSWAFYNDFARNFIVFGVGNSSSSHADNRKNNFLVLEEIQLSELMGSLRKKFTRENIQN